VTAGRCKRADIFAVYVCLLLALTFPLVCADSTCSQTLVLTAYRDGFVRVDETIELDHSALSVNSTLFGETYQTLIVTEENGLPLNYSVTGNIIVVYNLGSMKINISYLTEDLTSKEGKYWTVSVDCLQSTKFVMPSNASIISLSNVPDIIENSKDQITLTMPPGINEITYTTEHIIEKQENTPDVAAGFELWLIAVALSLVIASISSIVGLWFYKSTRRTKQQLRQPEENLTEVDLDKLFHKHRDLRQDEAQVIRFLASKQGKAFESELFELLNLPRTTTWRLIRRLEGMEIVDIKKSRRQNIVLIREKYLKKQAK
jgi:uncharacterized membrane protein